VIKGNLDKVSRIVRLLIGLPFATSYLYERHFSQFKSLLFLAIGFYFLVTAFIGWRPYYQSRRSISQKAKSS
jgi:hypothetical protein